MPQESAETLQVQLASPSASDFAIKALLRAMPFCLPLAVRWASQQEQKILRVGVALDELQRTDARLIRFLSLQIVCSAGLPNGQS
jgi:hypothetical protein